jgi:hypothetical protein
VFALVVLVRTRAQILYTQSGATWLIKHRDITGAT